VVVVGGGYIGMEVSSGLNKNGLDVTMVFPEPWMMPRLFTDEIASFYEDFLAGKGITLLKGNTAKAFKGENGKVGPRVTSNTVCVVLCVLCRICFDKDVFHAHGVVSCAV
jgi:NADPH-dependent 2,4-dienoyl-CoA reductase/sulfur reductase-like enzyme